MAKSHADYAAFFVLVDLFRERQDTKLTESDIDSLLSDPKLLDWTAWHPAHPEADLEELADRAGLWLERQADHILSLYLRLDISGLRASDRQVLEAVYRLALRQGVRVLASSRYLALLVPDYGYKTIQDRSPKLAERGFFKFFHGKSSTPWQRTNLDSSNTYELPLFPTEPGESPENPTGLEPLTPDEIEALREFQHASARLKKTKPPRRVRVVPPELDLTMTLDEIRNYRES